MGKRSDFDKVPRDFYPTVDPFAVVPLIPYIRGLRYAEPCYGNGDLEDLLYDVAFCAWRSDVRETVGCSKVIDALELTSQDLRGASIIITNPPFTKSILLPLIDHLTSLKPCWLLLPADIMHNGYFTEYMQKCLYVVSIGRLRWFRDSKSKSKDNFCWYYWSMSPTKTTTTFVKTYHKQFQRPE